MNQIDNRLPLDADELVSEESWDSAPSHHLSGFPVFDRTRMTETHNQEILILALEALENAKRSAGLILDWVGPFGSIEPEVLAEISEKLLERRWYARLIKWLYRVLREAPEGFVMSAEAVILHPCWEWLRSQPKDSREFRSWELFQDRFEELLSDAWDNPSTPTQVTSNIGNLQWMYFKWVSWDNLEAARAFRDAYREGNESSLFPYAQILIERKRYRAAMRVLEYWWSRHGSFACLKRLSELQFQLGNSAAAFELLRKHGMLASNLENSSDQDLLNSEDETDEDERAASSPVFLPAGRLLNDFLFPRDFDALEANGADGGLILYGHDKIQRLLSAVSAAEAELPEWSAELIEFQLRIFQLLAIEYRFDGAANRYITYLMEMYEWDAEKRAILITTLTKSPIARVYLRLSEWNQDECTRLDYDLNDPEDLAEVVEAHLHLAAEHLLSQESAPIISMLGDLAVRHGFDRVSLLVDELMDIQIRTKEVLIEIGEEPREYFLECQRQAEKALEGRINYSGILSRVLTAECELDYLPLRNLGVLISIALQAAMVSRNTQYVRQLIERINPVFLGMKWAKCLATIFRYTGYENQALRFYCFADLRDAEVIWPLLEMAIATQESATRTLDYFLQRPDCDKEYPIHLPTILSDLLVRRKGETGSGRYDSELLTYLWEAMIVYSNHDTTGWEWSKNLPPDFPRSPFGASAACFSSAYEQGNVRAKRRLAEYYLYHSEYPHKSVTLFRELYAETNDPTFLVDLARAEYASLPNQWNGVMPHSQAEFLLDLLKNLPADHPDRVTAYLQFSLGGTEAAFFDACSLIPTASKKQMSMIPEDLYESVIDRILGEARLLEKKREQNGDHLEMGEIIRHLTYIRILVRLLGETIDYAIGYIIDLTYYLSRFEDRSDTVVVLQFLSSYQNESSSPHSINHIDRHIFEETGWLNIQIERMSDPLVTLCEAEIDHLVSMYKEDEKLHELLEEAAYLFRAGLDCPALAERYSFRSASLRNRDPDCLPPKILPEGTTFVYNPSTILQ